MIDMVSSDVDQSGSGNTLWATPDQRAALEKDLAAARERIAELEAKHPDQWSEMVRQRDQQIGKLTAEVVRLRAAIEGALREIAGALVVSSPQGCVQRAGDMLSEALGK